MKTILLLLGALGCTLSLNAQFVQLTQGAGYVDAVYYDLSTRTETAVDLAAWDIAFSVDPRGAGVHINEAVA